VERSVAVVTERKRSPDLEAVARFLGLAITAEERVEDLRADCYFCVDVIGLPAAFRLKELTGGLVMCDIKESLSLRDRSLPTTLPPLAAEYLDHVHNSYVRDCDHRVTVGWTLAEELASAGIDAEVLPNYRVHVEPEPDGSFRRLLGISPDAEIVLAINNIVSGVDELLEAIDELGNVHLVVLGKVKPPDYAERFARLVQSRGLGSRVHLVDPVPYERLVHVAAECDAGLILLDASISNHRVSLPNRIFDLLGAHLPVITPTVRDIARLVEQFDCGEVIDEHPISAASWVRSIRGALDDQARLTANAARGARELDWATNEARLLELFAGCDSVTLVHHRNLHIHQRTIRLAHTLAGAGKRVTFATEVTEPVTADFPFPVVDLAG
jgi:glycosyltransferase involved in cell wall biosynthesis